MRNSEPDLNKNNVKIFANNTNECLKVREYINPAVYVETTYDMEAYKEKSIYMNIPGGGDHPKIIKVKRCVCFTNPGDCPCHPKAEIEVPEYAPDTRQYIMDRNGFTNSTPSLINGDDDEKRIDTPNFDSDSGITIKATNSTCDLHLSIPSLSTSLSTVRIIDEETREENFKVWCAKKDQERKLAEEKVNLLNEIKRKQREQQLEIERENFRRWLANKKKQEEIKKKETEVKLEEERTKEELRQKRLQENQQNFKVWLKKKEEILLEKKNKDQVEVLKKEELRQRRVQFSAKAYDIWLQQSKSRPKPLPLNRGLESLKSSLSVTYINPQPWVPNIDMKQKPASQ